MLRRLSLILVLVAPSCAPRATVSHAMDRAPLELAGPIVVPLEPMTRPVVRVALDGRGSRPFLVDSGASISAITDRCAAELGLEVFPYSQAFEVVGAGYGTARIEGYVRPGQMRIGDLRILAPRLSIIAEEALGETEVDGLLGQDLLGRLIVVVDMQRGALHLVPSEAGGAREYIAAAGLGSGEWLTIQVPFEPSPLLPLTVGEREIEVEMLFDTGADNSSLPRTLIELLALEPVGTAYHPATGGGHEVAYYAVEGLNLVGLKMSGEFGAAPRERGLLGMNVLGQFVLVLDGPAQTVWMHARD